MTTVKTNDPTILPYDVQGKTLHIALSTNSKAILRSLRAFGADAESIIAMDAHDGELEGPRLDASGREVHTSIPRSQFFQFADMDSEAIRRAHLSDPRLASYVAGLEGVQTRTGDGAGSGGRALASAAERMQRSDLQKFIDQRVRRFLDRHRLTQAALAGQTCSGAFRVCFLVEGGGQWGGGTLLKVFGHVLTLAKQYGVEIEVEFWITMPSTATGRRADQPGAAFTGLIREISLLMHSTNHAVSDRGFDGHDLDIPTCPLPLVRLVGPGNSSFLFDRDDRCDMIAWFLRIQSLNSGPAATYFHNNAPTDRRTETFSGVGCAVAVYDQDGATTSIAAHGVKTIADALLRSTDVPPRPPCINLDPAFSARPDSAVLHAQRWGRLASEVARARRRDALRYANSAVQHLASIEQEATRTAKECQNSATTAANGQIDRWWRDVLDRSGLPAARYGLERLGTALTETLEAQSRVSDEAQKTSRETISRVATNANSLRSSKQRWWGRRLVEALSACFGSRQTDPKYQAAQVIAEAREAVAVVERAIAAESQLCYIGSIKAEVDRVIGELAALDTALVTKRAQAVRTLEHAGMTRRLQTGFLFKFPTYDFIQSAADREFTLSRAEAICRQAIRLGGCASRIADDLENLVVSLARQVEMPGDFVSYFSGDAKTRERALDAIFTTATSTLPITIENRPDRSRPRHRVVHAPLGSLAGLRTLLDSRVKRGADQVDWQESPFPNTIVITEEIRNLTVGDIPECEHHDRAFDSLPPEYRQRFCTIFSEQEVARNSLIPRALTREAARIVAVEALALDVVRHGPGYVYRDSNELEIARGWDGLIHRLLENPEIVGRIQESLQRRCTEVGRQGVIDALSAAQDDLLRLAAPKHHGEVREAINKAMTTVVADVSVSSHSVIKEKRLIASDIPLNVNGGMQRSQGISRGNNHGNGHDGGNKRSALTASRR